MENDFNFFKYTVICCCLFFLSVAAAQVADKAENISPLLVGEKIPAEPILDDKGTEHNIVDILAQKSTLLVIFRGSWCKYCNLQLAGLADAEQEIQQLGYQIVAISPDDYNKIGPVKTKNSLTFQVYADPHARLITKMGLAFDSGGKRDILPVPATMVLDQNGEILFEHINPNYKVRMGTGYLMAVLKALKDQKD